jgi:hypothetical protein
MSRQTRTILLTLAGILTLGLAIIASASAAPIKLIPSGSFGKGPGTGTNEFSNSKSVSGAPNGNVYVADENNHRVQEFTANGEFVLMFGREVNATTKGDLCTAASKNACQAGIPGNAPGQFGYPESVSVDPVTGDVYIAETIIGLTVGQRVQKLTSEGGFILEIGEEVNETTKGNLCTQAEVENEKVKCGGPSPTPSSTTHGAFDFLTGEGNLLATGGQNDLLYVAGVDKVEEFEPDGAWQHTIAFSQESKTVSLAVENSTSELYIAYSQAATDTIRAYTSEGVEVAKPITISSQEGQSNIVVQGMTIDGQGHAAVLVHEYSDSVSRLLGLLYEASSGHEITTFDVPSATGVTGIGFDTIGQLFGAAANTQQVLIYNPVPVAEMTTGESNGCKQGAEIGTDVTFSCKLEGTANPYDVAETEAWFGWGSSTEAATCLLQSETGKIKLPTVEEPLPVSETIEELRPNQVVCYQLTGDDKNVRFPEELTGETLSLRTAAVHPVVEGVPSVSFVQSSSAVLRGMLNPENTSTEYFFEYSQGNSALAECSGVKSGCPGVQSTKIRRSSLYGNVGTTTEIGGLQPGTLYSYRLTARNELGEESVYQGGVRESTFTTLAAPNVTAITGIVEGVTSTSAVVYGSVDPDGAPATYAFEIGLEQGTATQYGTVLSGPTGTVSETKALQLTGLQPGTEYSYRIKVSSGYGTATGSAMSFKTAGLPVALPSPESPQLLATPKVNFEKQTRPPKPCKKDYVRNKQDKCIKVKKSKHKAKGIVKKRK